MKYSFLFLLIFAGCTTLPQLYQAAEDIADDSAIQISLSKEAIEDQNQINITIDLNKKT